MFDVVKKAISFFTDRPIDRGIGVSTDSTIHFKKMPEVVIPNTSLSKYTVKYGLRDNLGQFELVDIIRRIDGTECFILRHMETNEKIRMSRNIFTLLFSRIS